MLTTNGSTQEHDTEMEAPLPRYPGLERYKLTKMMGEGTFSKVYSAYDKVIKKDVAIKVVDKNLLSVRQRSNTLKEISLLRRLNHPHIVRMISFHETDTNYFIVMELCSGGELFNVVVDLGALSEPQARYVLTQVAEAVRYLHEDMGVVHRDIKLENLLYEYPTPDDCSSTDQAKKESAQVGIGTVKLADFGLSKVIWDQNTQTPCGTIGYTAPEIVRDQTYSKGVDMWAIGCILYTIRMTRRTRLNSTTCTRLCGFPPFFDDDISNLTHKVAKGHFTFLSPWWDEISDGAKDLVRHLLTVNPSKRYDINALLKHPWMKGLPLSNRQCETDDQFVQPAVNFSPSFKNASSKGQSWIPQIDIQTATGSHGLVSPSNGVQYDMKWTREETECSSGWDDFVIPQDLKTPAITPTTPFPQEDYMGPCLTSSTNSEPEYFPRQGEAPSLLGTNSMDTSGSDANTLSVETLSIGTPEISSDSRQSRNLMTPRTPMVKGMVDASYAIINQLADEAATSNSSPSPWMNIHQQNSYQTGSSKDSNVSSDNFNLNMNQTTLLAKRKQKVSGKS